MVVNPEGYIQLWRSVLRILLRLLFTGSAEIPEHNFAVVAGASQHGLLEWVPRDRLNRILMALQRVKLRIQVSQIPQANGLVCRSSGQNGLCRRVE